VNRSTKVAFHFSDSAFFSTPVSSDERKIFRFEEHLYPGLSGTIQLPQRFFSMLLDLPIDKDTKILDPARLAHYLGRNSSQLKQS
jgi:hypothetical protein